MVVHVNSGNARAAEFLRKAEHSSTLVSPLALLPRHRTVHARSRERPRVHHPHLLAILRAACRLRGHVIAFLYGAGLFALDAILVLGGSVLAIVFLVLAARATGARLVMPCLLGCAFALFATFSGCGCRRLDNACEAALHALRGPTEDEAPPPIKLPARPTSIPLRTPWPPASPGARSTPR
jgi:hypothetical protein